MTEARANRISGRFRKDLQSQHQIGDWFDFRLKGYERAFPNLPADELAAPLNSELGGASSTNNKMFFSSCLDPAV